MIRFSSVTFQYPATQAPVIADLSMEIDKGEFCVIFGNGGSGKSTLIKLLTAELQPAKGEILVGDTDVHALRATAISRYRQSIGLIGQGSPLIPDRTLSENITLPLEIRSYSRKRIGPQVESVISRFGLSSQRSLKPRDISMGEQQRAIIARAVVGEPLVLLADEPTAHLDLRAAHELIELLRRENLRGMTVILTTSDERISPMIPEARVVTLTEPVTV